MTAVVKAMILSFSNRRMADNVMTMRRQSYSFAGIAQCEISVISFARRCVMFSQKCFQIKAAKLASINNAKTFDKYVIKCFHVRNALMRPRPKHISNYFSDV